MGKNKTKVILGHCAALCIFALIAVASSSSKDAIRGVDDFVEGYNYGKSLVSDASDEIEPVEMDSVITDTNSPLVATIK
ncbi:MAG: hypothetical protein K2O00_09460 [Muribaculaceae bacterium]|nr:hypothetical protein [Muribaculaceae bacterium]